MNAIAANSEAFPRLPDDEQLQVIESAFTANRDWIKSVFARAAAIYDWERFAALLGSP